MFDDTQRQWLHHPETGGYFNCPADAVGAWKGKGWEESDPPEEPNAAIAEQEAYRERQAASAKANKAAMTKEPSTDEDDDSKTRTTKSTKSAAKSEER